MKTPTIFITYNPKADHEQTLAVRLHTIGAVNGFRMFLPDRYNSESMLDNETKRRIAESDYFIFFATKFPSKIVHEEINYFYDTFKDKSRIIVVYDSRNKKPINDEHLTVFPFNPVTDNQTEFLNRIISSIRQKNINIPQKNDNQLFNAIGALLGIGLGLYVLDSIFAER